MPKLSTEKLTTLKIAAGNGTEILTGEILENLRKGQTPADIQQQLTKEISLSTAELTAELTKELTAEDAGYRDAQAALGDPSTDLQAKITECSAIATEQEKVAQQIIAKIVDLNVEITKLEAESKKQTEIIEQAKKDYSNTHGRWLGALSLSYKEFQPAIDAATKAKEQCQQQINSLQQRANAGLGILVTHYGLTEEDTTPMDFEGIRFDNAAREIKLEEIRNGIIAFVYQAYADPLQQVVH